jgi:hypothetical protein
MIGALDTAESSLAVALRCGRALLRPSPDLLMFRAAVLDQLTQRLALRRTLQVGTRPPPSIADEAISP